MTRVLILGGTSDANMLAKAVAGAGIAAIYSYAGRTEVPVRQPLPVRTGGYGGTDGLRRYLCDEGITHVVDATHPFAAQISCNAIAACAGTATPLIALVRPPWSVGEADRWIDVADLGAAVRSLPDEATSVFLAIGRQHLQIFAEKPQHTYILRVVDEPVVPLPLPKADIIVARGPFIVDGDLTLMRSKSVEWVVTRNSGGEGARSKIDAARQLGLPVIMIARPEMPVRRTVATVEEVMTWLAHEACLGA